ncbi:uncharacterized protein LOC144132861 isoform X5 [Amblyomma americanum]
MARVEVLAVLFLALGVSANRFTTQGCDYAGIDLDEAVEKVLAKFPKYFHAGPQDFIPIFPGFELAGLNVTGMDQIERYGPLIPYCLKGKRMMQVDLISLHGVRFNVPWRWCSGKLGSLSVRSELFRFTAQFRIDSEGVPGGDVKLFKEGPTVPVYAHNVPLFVSGSGPIDAVVTEVLTKFIPSHLWGDMVLPYFMLALQRTLE